MAVLVAVHVFAAVVVGVVHVDLVAAWCSWRCAVCSSIYSLQKAAEEEVAVAFLAVCPCAAVLFIVFAVMHALPVDAVCSSEKTCVGEGV